MEFIRTDFWIYILRITLQAVLEFRTSNKVQGRWNFTSGFPKKIQLIFFWKFPGVLSVVVTEIQLHFWELIQELYKLDHSKPQQGKTICLLIQGRRWTNLSPSDVPIKESRRDSECLWKINVFLSHWPSALVINRRDRSILYVYIMYISIDWKMWGWVFTQWGGGVLILPKQIV